MNDKTAGAADDDEIEQSSAPLLEHLAELRTRLIWALLALAGAAVLCFVFAEPIYNMLLMPLVNVAEIERGDTDFRLIYTGPLEVFFAQLKLAILPGRFIPS